MPHNLKTELKNAELTSFPYQRNYNEKFSQIEIYMNSNVHPSVVGGAANTDGGLLNDHGVDHVKMVIERAGQLLKPSVSMLQPKLTPYEIFLLLCAIHVHDVGNISGRTDHEKTNGNISNELKPFLDDDVLEIRTFREIAEAHGGRHNGSKDKLSVLPEICTVNSQDVRFRALAAILKFADELADDKTRGDRRLLESGNLNEGSQVYHKYSLSIHSAVIRAEEKSIDLVFFLTLDDLKRTWGKRHDDDVKQVYIVDEIYERTKKMHYERVYCSRYMRDFVEIDQISVKIEICEMNEDGRLETKENIAYILEETGYPDEAEIHQISAAVKTDFLSGKALFEKYRKAGEA